MKELMHETRVWPLEYPKQLKEAVSATAQLWEEFCSLPSDVQDVFTAVNMFNGSGFERKLGTGDENSHFSKDKKLNFDITARDIPALEARLEEIDNPLERATAQKFIAAASRLIQETPVVVADFGKLIEDNFGVGGFHELAQNSANDAFFRCIYYPPTENSGEVIGEPHVDNSGFTLHLFESTAGCEALAPDTKTWSPMPVASGHALAFPSMQTQLYSEGKVDGLCHRILSNETTQEFGRIAIVCFVALKDIPSYDRARHGRLQERTPGFNYGMDPSEFAELFVK